MKVAGIIAEYNPFHNGHAYHIEEVRKKTGADYIIAIMSGNFVQRGGPAIVDKYTRTKMALLGGADLVIELPVVAATASAETFARCGVAILNSIGVVTHLGFGCETDDLELLHALANLFVEEPKEYQELLSSYLKEGLSYPAARAKAAGEYFQKFVADTSITNRNSTHNVYADGIIDNTLNIEATLNNPNNILAIEYLKALKQINSTIKPCPILRQGNHYHDEDLSGSISSATAIRRNMLELEVSTMEYENLLLKYIPQICLDILLESLKLCPPIIENDFSSLLHYKLYLEQNDFRNYSDVKDDLANRILNLQESYVSFTVFIDEIKTKNMTYTNVSRALLHILLDIKKSHMNDLTSSNYAPYIRVLGFRKSSSLLLNKLKNSSIPVVAQLAKDKKGLNDTALRLLQLDISSAHIYNLMKINKSGLSIEKNEYRTPLFYL